MAITRTNIYYSTPGPLYNFLLENAVPEYFTSVTKDDDEKSISCYIDDTLFLKIYVTQLSTSANAVTVTTKTGQTISVKHSYGYGYWRYAYKCNNGISLCTYYAEDEENKPICLTITKDNEGNTTVIMTSGLYTRENSASSYYVVTPNLTEIKSVSYSTNTCVDYKKISLSPFVIGCENGNYTPNAFYMPITNLFGNHTLVINGENYISNGAWCLKD